MNKEVLLQNIDKVHTTEMGTDRIKKNLKLDFIKIDSLEKAKNAPCVFNNWANFYKGKFVSNTILNANAFEKLLK